MSKKLGLIIWSLTFLLINIFAFSIPIDKTTVFWIAYIFTVIAFAIQLIIWNLAFRQSKVLKSKFLGFPIVYVGIVYLIIQLIAFGVFLLFQSIAPWITFTTCVAILFISCIFLVATEMGRKKVSHVELHVERKVSTTKRMQADIELIAEKQTDIVMKNRLESLAEKIKYSDPMSDDSLTSIEDEINSKITELKTQPTMDIEGSVDQIEILLLERNKKTKLLK